MKQKLAALLALLLVLTAAACAAKNAPQPPQTAQPAAPVQSEQPDGPAASEQTPNSVLPSDTSPVPSGGEVGLAVEFTDEPLCQQADIEEIVSYEITVPQLTLESAEASQRINDGFVRLADSLISYAQQTVYPMAQQKQAIGFLESSYTVTAENGQIAVAFTVTERYSSEDGQTVQTNDYLFDAATGARIYEE